MKLFNFHFRLWDGKNGEEEKIKIEERNEQMLDDINGIKNRITNLIISRCKFKNLHLGEFHSLQKLKLKSSFSYISIS